MELFGWGRKNTADVNKKGQLLTYTEVFSTEYDAAHDGDSFTMDIDAKSVNGAEHLCVLKNGHSTNEMVISSVTLWMDAYKKTTFIEARLNETFSYLAEGTKVVPTNVSAGKVGGAQGDFYVIAAAGTDITTFAGTAVIAGRFIFTTTPIKWTKVSGWHIPPGQVFSLYNNGQDNIYSGYISFYYK